MHKGKAEDQKGKSAPATEFLTIGTPANRETVTIIAVGAAGPTGASVDFTPALAKNRSPVSTTDGKELMLRRYTQPDKDQLLLLSRLDLSLPPQPKPQLLDKRPDMGKLQMHL